MDVLSTAMEAIARPLAEFGLGWLAQSTVLLLAGVTLARLARGRGAALQSTVLRVTLVAVLLCPLASVSLGALGVQGVSLRFPDLASPQEAQGLDAVSEPASRLPAETGPVAVAQIPGPAGPPRALPVSPTRGTASSAAVTAMSSRPLDSGSQGMNRVAALFICLALLWVAVATALLLRFRWACAYVRRLRSTAEPAPEAIVERCRAAAQRLGVRQPSVRVSTRVQSPCLAGLRRPVVLLPDAGVLAASDEVLVHELAHLKRRDGLWNTLVSLTCAVLWYQPLLWALRRRLVDTADDVADDYVVHHGLGRRDYARRLTDIAERFQPCAAEAVAGVGVVAFTSSLGRRVQRILDTGRHLSTRTSIRALAVVLVVAVVGIALAGLIGAGRVVKADGYDPADWRETIENGVTVELVGIRYAKGSKKDPWWRPDGTVVTEPATWSTFAFSKPDPNMPEGEAFEFAYRMTEPKDANIERLGCQILVGWWKPKVHSNYGSALLGTDGVWQDRSFKVHIPNPKDVAKVKIGVKVGNSPPSAQPHLQGIRTWARFKGVRLKPDYDFRHVPPSPRLTAHTYWKRGERFYVHQRVGEMEWRPLAGSAIPDFLIDGTYYQADMSGPRPVNDRPYESHSVWAFPGCLADPLDLALGKHRLVVVWKDVEATRELPATDSGEAEAESVKLDELRSNEIAFEVVEEYPEGYFAPVYEDGWDEILAQRVVVTCTDAQEENRRPRLHLDVAPLPVEVSFRVFAEEKHSRSREEVGALILPVAVPGFEERWFQPEALTKESVGAQEWRLVFVPYLEGALCTPPVRHYYGREFVTDWVRFQPAKEWGVAHALNMPLDALPQIGEEIVAVLSPATFKQQLVMDLHTGRVVHRSMSDVYIEWIRLAGEDAQETSGFAVHGLRTWCGPMKKLPSDAYEERVVGGEMRTVATEREEPALNLWTADSVEDLPPGKPQGPSPFGIVEMAWAPLEAFKGLPAWPAPYAMAFETVYGDIGVIQYLRTHEQRVVMRYKFLQYASKQKVYLPSFAAAGEIHQTLDLATGEVLPLNGITKNLARGDLFYNSEDSPALWCLRDGTMRLRDGDALVPAESLPMDSLGVRGYPLPELPCGFQLACADGAAYEVRVLSLLNGNEGVAIEYWSAATGEGP
ncbi:MAG: M56 family metallopeptidase [bacterium]|nr:M56 family metallopeptidase [bacterium]